MAHLCFPIYYFAKYVVVMDRKQAGTQWSQGQTPEGARCGLIGWLNLPVPTNECQAGRQWVPITATFSLRGQLCTTVSSSHCVVCVGSLTSNLHSWSAALLGSRTVLAHRPRNQLAPPPLVGFPPTKRTVHSLVGCPGGGAECVLGRVHTKKRQWLNLWR